MRWYEWTSIVAVWLFSFLIFAVMFGGLIPCSHRCYWCRQPLAPADEAVRGPAAD